MAHELIMLAMFRTLASIIEIISFEYFIGINFLSSSLISHICSLAYNAISNAPASMDRAAAECYITGKGAAYDAFQ